MEEKEQEKDTPILLLFGAFVAALAVESWALTLLWRWHVEPLVRWALGFWPALGFWAVAQHVKHMMSKVSYKSESNRKSFEKVVASIIGSLFLVGVGYLAFRMR